ncbi:hypothetical protein FJZ41_01475 [Candidatus Shapirobacteria bacterium]|nr:hypothetical protein [Candidatus Shapirobacteria bacterium]
MKKIVKFLKKFWPGTLFSLFALCFSCWLMWQTFAYHQGTIYIAAKAWSDFSATLPLIRSFSWGQNFPPGDPLLAGIASSYHFLFYLLVGGLEYLGLRLDFALNLPSLLGFTLLMITIFWLAKLLFKNYFVALLGVILFLFNGSFSFWEFFKQHPLSWRTPLEIFQNKFFPSFGPYDGKIVSAFWNLNIYTNQRHLALAYGLLIFFLISLLLPVIKKQKISHIRIILIGLGVGFFPFLHSVGYFMMMVVLGMLFLLLQGYRKSFLFVLFMALAIGAPQLFLIRPGGVEGNLNFHPGYLIANQLTLVNFFHYWFWNLGLAFVLIPLGVSKAPSLAKKIFWAFLPLFFIGNLFQFSQEIAANHKFFNFFIIVGNLFVAYAVFLIWQKGILGKFLATFLIFFLTFSGIIDFFPIKNDSWMKITDAPKNPDIEWIKKNTPPSAFFLNSSYLYHPASLAGRKIFLGWPYFPWAGGYDPKQRDNLRKFIYQAPEGYQGEICQELKNNHLDFLTTEKNPEEGLLINHRFFEKNFVKIYHNQQTDFRIYDVQQTCL